MNSSDTIVAISSAVGAAARMIVRMSGGDAHRIARELMIGDCGELRAGSAAVCRLWPGVLGWVYSFCGPGSYTGEDLVEIHLPGNPLIARMVLDEMVRSGARQAEAGEFTARAYFNGRMDLTQAEGVAATIAAHSERELRAARQLLGGELARRLGPVMENIAQTLALVEVGIDFSDEDVTFLSADEVRGRCEESRRALAAILNESARFERLTHEPRIVLIGRPNAGKSTLLNSLAGNERAVVSEVAGTTRDAIWAEMKLARGVVRVVDVAGVEIVGSEQAAMGSVEEGIARQMHLQAMGAARTGDVVVWVEDCLGDRGRMELGREVDLVVESKVDLLEGDKDKRQKTEEADRNVCPTSIKREESDRNVCISARTGEGMAELRRRLDELAFGSEQGAGLALNARHVAAIEEGRQALERAGESILAGAEVVAMELREALDALGGVLGKISPDDLLGRVFLVFASVSD